MNPISTTPWLVTGMIVVVVVLSGPLVPTVDFTSPTGSKPSLDERSSATISVIEPPSDGFRIAPGRFGTGPYLYASPVVIHVERVSGVPIIAYELSVPGLNYVTASLTFPSDEHEGENLTLTLERSTIRPGRVTEPAYPAHLSITVRTGNETRTVFGRNTTVTVEGIDDA